jgi:hypothetical protein
VWGCLNAYNRIILSSTLVALAGLLFYLPFSGAIASPTTKQAPTPTPINGAPASKLYWFGAQGIVRANPDGTGTEELGPIDMNNPTDFAADAEGGKIYWAEEGPPAMIRRSNLDGSNVEDVVILEPSASVRPATPGTSQGGGSVAELASLQTSSIVPLSIALDVDSDKTYWTNANGEIHRANLDGTDIEVIVALDPGVTLLGLVLDVEGGTIYWTNQEDATILQANLDGSDMEVLVTLTEPGEAALDLELDLSSDTIFWTNLSGMIQRASLDGTDIEVVVEDIGVPYGIALDIEADRIFWTEPEIGVIKWASLDGDDVEVVVTGLVEVRDVLLIVEL